MKRKWAYAIAALAIAAAIALWWAGDWLWQRFAELHGSHGSH